VDDALLKQALREALAVARGGQQAAAATALVRLHERRPDSAQVAIALSRLQVQDDRPQAAATTLQRALGHQPDHEILAVELATVQSVHDPVGAIAGLRTFVSRHSASPLAWLLLGHLLRATGSHSAALEASFQALLGAHALGAWQEPATTPRHLLDLVSAAVAQVSAGRRELLTHCLDHLRDEHGSPALLRMDQALRGYLGDEEVVPPDAMQRPRFLFIPGLPTTPYMDPFLHPWAPRLQGAFREIRDEALSLINEQWQLEDFVAVKEGDRIDNYLGGAKPSWEAFFFYRHGQRFADNHQRCPRTSAVLESLDLSRIPGQTPEVCFSVLAPGTHILPHHGVSNMRAVMHLPLVVPEQCALHLVDRGVHHWVEGELVMFDDTFLHESWNRSDSVRIIVLMDCWNPHLTAVEREAAKVVAPAIGLVDVALKAANWSGARGQT